MVVQPGPVMFRIPRELAVEYAGMLCASWVTVVDRMSELFGFEPELSARWNNVKTRADLALETMQRILCNPPRRLMSPDGSRRKTGF